jgi:hypothetical protein
VLIHSEWITLEISGYTSGKVLVREGGRLRFVQLVLLEGVFLLSAGMIFFGGIWGTAAATVALTGINFLTHDPVQFWHWEIALVLLGMVGMVLLLIAGKIAKKSQVVTGLAGGLITLVLFGAFITPIVAIILWALVVGTGMIPNHKKNQVLRSFAPTILRLVLGCGWIIFGNLLTR